MNVYHGKFRSAIKLFPELHTGNITDNNWQSSSGQNYKKNKEGMICTTMFFYHSKLQLKNM